MDNKEFTEQAVKEAIISFQAFTPNEVIAIEKESFTTWLKQKLEEACSLKRREGPYTAMATIEVGSSVWVDHEEGFVLPNHFVDRGRCSFCGLPMTEQRYKEMLGKKMDDHFKLL